MSVREFAAHLGVSDRMVSKWEAGGEGIRPRPLNQAALDTSLALSSPEVKSRFASISVSHEAHATRPRQSMATSSWQSQQSAHDVMHVLRHPLDGKLMTLIDAGPFRSVAGRKPLWLPAFYVDIHPTSNADYARFLAATGHRAPAHWPDGRYTIADDPDALHDDPVANLTWEDANAYAFWASKELPTTSEWDRAARGTEGMVVADLWEWCRAEVGPGRRGPKGVDSGGFRCASSVADMLTLLAI